MDPTTDLLPLRDRLRLTQQAFADAYGLTLGAVKDWETGRRKPDSAALAYLRTITAEPEAVRRIQEAAAARGRVKARAAAPGAVQASTRSPSRQGLTPHPATPQPATDGHFQTRTRLIAALKARSLRKTPIRVRVPVLVAAPVEPPSGPAYRLPAEDPGLVQARMAGARAGMIRAALRGRAFNGNGGR